MLHLVAQCSVIGVSVAATPPCSAIRFRMEFSRVRHLPPPIVRLFRIFSLQNTQNITATGGWENRCDTLFWGAVARHSCDISTWCTFWIFFFLLGCRGAGRGGGDFLLKIPEGGVSRAGGGDGPGGFAGNWGGGGD